MELNKLMAGLTDMAGGNADDLEDIIQRARAAWEESITRHVDTLRSDLRQLRPEIIASRSGVSFQESSFEFFYWERRIRITWPSLVATYPPAEQAVSAFDTAMLIYYLHSADGAPQADRWIGFRELPNGAFYHQAFQGYSGNRVAAAFGESPERFTEAAKLLKGWPLPGLAEYAFSFQPLPRLRLAAVLWPGDDEFPTQASILFDAAASHYMTTDGLALLGSGLASRLIK